MKTSSLILVILFYILGILLKQSINYYLIAACSILSLYLMIKNKNVKYLTLLLVTFSSFLMTPEIHTEEPEDYQINCEFTITEKGGSYYLVTDGNERYLIYLDIEIETGDRIYIVGKTSRIATFSIPNLSTFKEYLLYKKVYLEIKIEEYNLIENFNLRRIVKNAALANLSLVSQDFIKLIVFGDKTSMLELYSDLKELSIVQLFVISGFHINLLFAVLSRLLFKKNIIAFIIVAFYIYLLNFPIPAMRSLIALFLVLLNQHCFHNKMSKSQIFCITILFLLLIDPLSLLTLSFQLTVMATLSLLLLGRIKSKLMRSLITPLLVYLFLLPLLININFEINILSFIFNSLLTLPISILYIGGILVSFLKILDIFYLSLVLTLNQTINVLKTINFNLIVGHISTIVLIAYYFSILSLFYFREIRFKKGRNTSLILLCLILLFTYYDRYLYSEYSLTFLDVGQGDALLINGKNGDFAILVDTGGSIYSDIGNKRVIPYIKSLGINRLDAIIVTHNDYDHMGALATIVENFKVKQVFREEFQNFQKDGLTIQNINVYQDSNQDDNYNSHVLLVSYFKYHYLLMGDAPQEIENKIIEDYDLPFINVLKIGHHGSKTSTSEQFIAAIQPECVFISVGRNNLYHHPHQEVILLLDKYHINYYRSDEDGSLVVQNKNNLSNYLKILCQILYNIIIKRR